VITDELIGDERRSHWSSEGCNGYESCNKKRVGGNHFLGCCKQSKIGCVSCLLIPHQSGNSKTVFGVAKKMLTGMRENGFFRQIRTPPRASGSYNTSNGLFLNVLLTSLVSEN
jgi:hypothetical protein